MSHEKEIILFRCPYCEDKWVEEEDLVCEECVPKANVDMALMDIYRAIDTLKSVDSEILKFRFTKISGIITSLKSLTTGLFINQLNKITKENQEEDQETTKPPIVQTAKEEGET